MRKNIQWALVVLVLLAPRPSPADVTSDRAAAILVFPRIVASTLASQNIGITFHRNTDTLVQISNTSDQPINLHCFYINATSRCSVSDFACDADNAFLNCPAPQDLCLPQWSETDFDVFLTPRQPIAWSALDGLQRGDLPLDGVDLSGPGGSSNAGTLVPPVRLRSMQLDIPNLDFGIFEGELKCVVVDGTGRAIPRNVVKGEASLVTLAESTSENFPDAILREPLVSKYSAVGIQAIEGDLDGDGVLVLGGDAGEYNGCPNVLIAEHFFDQIDEQKVFLTELALVPCSQDLRLQIPGSTTAQFLVFNEFEQRFSTSARVDCLFDRFLSFIDTRQPLRSIFSAAVAGTLVGQTRIRGVQVGLLGVLIEGALFEGFSSGDDAFQLGIQGDRSDPDRIVLPH